MTDAPADREYIITEFQLNQLQGYVDLDFICQAIRSRPHTGVQSERDKVLDELATEIMKQAGIDKQRPFNPDTDCIPQLGVDELSDIIATLRECPC